MQKTKQLVIVGDSAFAEIACEYFEAASPYSVEAFAVEQAFLKRPSLMDRPVVPWEDLERLYPPASVEIYAAIVYSQLNRLRARFVAAAKARGYALASFVSPHAFVAESASLGEHCFIFENNVVQPFARVGSNVVLWSGNHIGHHSVIGDNVFVASHVVISGFCDIGANSFLGVNTALANNISIGADCWLGPGVTVTKSIPAGSLVQAPDPTIAKVSAPRFFKVKD